VEKSDHLESLRAVIGRLHGCGARHVASAPVHEVFRGQTVWRGVVEVFDLAGHPKAKRCYAWAHQDGASDERERYVAVLELPPVISPETAVRASIMADARR
jgi:hypothetical protein